MKILFITKEFIVEPLGIMYLSSILKQKGHQVSLIKYKKGDNISLYDININDAVCFSSTTGQHKEYLDIARQIKEYKLLPKIIMGGAHPTYFPEVANEDCIDFIIKGEGEINLLKLLEDIQNNKTNGKVRDIEPLIQDLDIIPFPDRDLIYQFPKNRLNPIKNVMSSRGCPFSCNFCYAQMYKELYKGQKICRYRSISNVIKECIELKEKYPETKYIFFADDEFAFSNDRLKEFVKQYKRYVNIPFHCQLRIDLLDRYKAKLLKYAGCTSITFAIECGDEARRKNLLNKKIINQQILDGSKLLRKCGIKYRTENMIGLPEETVSDAIETLDLNIKCKPTIAWVSLYQPYQKTKLGDYCIKNNLLENSLDEIKETFFEDSILKLPNKNRFINLQRLFGFIVSFPILRPFVKLLINLPNNKFYNWLHIKWKRYCYDKKLYI